MVISDRTQEMSRIGKDLVRNRNRNRNRGPGTFSQLYFTSTIKLRFLNNDNAYVIKKGTINVLSEFFLD